MSALVLVDTNILVYARIPQDAVKRDRALSVLRRLAAEGTGALSTQVLAEFFATVTSARKFKVPMTSADAMEAVQDFVDVWPVLDVNLPVVLDAMRAVNTYQLSYWDAQIWATAKLNQVPVIYTEDGPTSAAIEGVRYINPLADPPVRVVKEAGGAGYALKRRAPKPALRPSRPR